MANFGRLLSKICSRTDAQLRKTDRQTHRNTLLPYWGRSKYAMRYDGYSGAGFVYRSVTLSTCAIYHNVLGILYSLLPRCLTAQNSIASSSKVGLV